MDIEAEMQKLQEEARRELAARDEAEAPDPQLPPNPSQPEKRAVADNPSLAESPSSLLSQAGAMFEAARTAKQVAEKVDPAVVKEAAELAEKAQGLKSLSMGAKIGWGIAALVGFVVTWNVLLAPLVTALIAIAILVLLVVAILKIVGFFDKDEDEAKEDA